MSDIEYNNGSYYQERESKGLALELRLGFIRKVFGILSAQLAMTVLFVIYAMNSISLIHFMVNNIGLLYFCLFLSIVIFIAIACYKEVANQTPTNYIFQKKKIKNFLQKILQNKKNFDKYIFSSNFCLYFLQVIYAFVCIYSDPQIVFIAAIMTLGVVLSLTYYALTTKTDVTMMGSTLFILSMVVFMFGIMSLFFQNRIFHIFYCCLGVILFGYYLIYDIQLLVGGKQFEHELDDYIIASIMIYLDIINLFLYILQILQQLQSKD